MSSEEPTVVPIIDFTTATGGDSAPPSSRGMGNSTTSSPAASRAGRTRSTAVRYVNKAAADNAALLLKANRSANCSEAHNTSLGLHAVVVGMQGWRKTMEDDHCILIADTMPTHSEVHNGVSSPQVTMKAVTSSPDKEDINPSSEVSPMAPAPPLALSPTLPHPVLGIIGVFDGHQNNSTAQYCSAHLPNAVCRAFIERGVGEAASEIRSEQNLEKMKTLCESALAAAFQQVDDSHRAAEGAHGGSTVGLVVLFPNYTVLANLGDCRLAVLRKDFSRVSTMVEHRLAVNPAEKARVESCGATVTNDRISGVLAVSRAIGDYAFKPQEADPASRPVSTTPEVVVVPRSPEDAFVVVGCDGVWETQTIEVIHKALLEACPPGSQTVLGTDTVYNIVNASCSTAVQHHDGAGAQLGCDNISLGVVQFG